MHVVSKDEQSPPRCDLGAGLEPDQAVGERNVLRLAAVDRRSTQEFGRLTFVEENVARVELEAIEHAREVHLFEVRHVDAVLENVGHSEIGPHVWPGVPVGVPLAPQLHLAHLRDS